MSERRVEITKGTLKLTANRKELVGIMETPDGIVFQFQDGVNLVFNDDYMTSSVKKRITNADLKFEDAHLIFNLSNYRSPVLVDTT